MDKLTGSVISDSAQLDSTKVVLGQSWFAKSQILETLRTSLESETQLSLFWLPGSGRHWFSVFPYLSDEKTLNRYCENISFIESKLFDLPFSERSLFLNEIRIGMATTRGVEPFEIDDLMIPAERSLIQAVGTHQMSDGSNIDAANDAHSVGAAKNRMGSRMLHDLENRAEKIFSAILEDQNAKKPRFKILKETGIRFVRLEGQTCESIRQETSNHALGSTHRLDLVQQPKVDGTTDGNHYYKIVLSSGDEIQASSLVYADSFGPAKNFEVLSSEKKWMSKVRPDLGILQVALRPVKGASAPAKKTPAFGAVSTSSEPPIETIDPKSCAEAFVLPLQRESQDEMLRHAFGYFVGSEGSTSAAGGHSLQDSIWTTLIFEKECEDNHDITKRLRRVKQAIQKAFQVDQVEELWLKFELHSIENSEKAFKVFGIKDRITIATDECGLLNLLDQQSKATNNDFAHVEGRAQGLVVEMQEHTHKLEFQG